MESIHFHVHEVIISLFPDQINNYVIRYLYVEDSHVNCQLFSLYSFILVE